MRQVSALDCTLCCEGGNSDLPDCIFNGLNRCFLRLFLADCAFFFFPPILCVKLVFAMKVPISGYEGYDILCLITKSGPARASYTSSDKNKIFQITTQLSDIHQVRYIPSLENMI